MSAAAAGPTTGAARKQAKRKLAGDWTKCMFWMTVKGRYCSIPRSAGIQFCGNHCGTSRVPCPLDPGHSVFEPELKHHLLVCNVTQEKLKRQHLEYIIPGVNLGTCSAADASCIAAVFDAKEPTLAAAMAGVDVAAFCERVLAVSERVTVLSSNIQPLHPCGDEYRRAQTARYGGKAEQRHINQQVSILANLEGVGLLQSSICYVEFGCGRGMLSLALADVLRPTCSLVLIDKASVKMKADKDLARNAACAHTRIRSDIADVSLGRLDSVKGFAKVVIVSKHLCGGATDLALRCLSNTRPAVSASVASTVSSSSTGDGADGASLPVAGVAIATCCHHRCTWEQYVAKEWFLSTGLTCVDFERLRLLSSWATCGWARRPASESASAPSSEPTAAAHAAEGEPDSEKDHAPAEAGPVHTLSEGMSVEYRERVGRACKLIIDTGRAAFMRALGYGCEGVVQYCDAKDSLEYQLLLGALL